MAATNVTRFADGAISTGGTNTGSLTIGSVSVGDLVVFAANVVTVGSILEPTSVSDSLGNTITSRVQVTSTTFGPFDVYEIVVTNPGTMTLSVTGGAGTNTVGIWGSQWTGAASWTYDANGAGNDAWTAGGGNGTDQQTADITFGAQSIAFAFFGGSGVGNASPTSTDAGWTTYSKGSGTYGGDLVADQAMSGGTGHFHAVYTSYVYTGGAILSYSYTLGGGGGGSPTTGTVPTIGRTRQGPPRRPPFYTSPLQALGGLPTRLAAGSVTEGADTVSGAGTLAIAAAGAVTEGADTVSSAGTLALAASASITEGADTLSAAGTLALAAAASITEGADTVGSAGAVAIAAASSITEGADTVAAAGSTVTPTIGLTPSKGPPRRPPFYTSPLQALGGTSTRAGAASITEGADTVSGAGALAIAGASAVTEGADTTSAAGAVAVAGAASPSEGADTTTSAGAVAIAAAAAITEGADAVSGAGALAIAGSSTTTEGADVLSASGGAVASIGAAAIIEGADTVSAAGSLFLAAALAINEGADTLIGRGTTGGAVDPSVASVTITDDALYTAAVDLTDDALYTVEAVLSDDALYTVEIEVS